MLKHNTVKGKWKTQGCYSKYSKYSSFNCKNENSCGVDWFRFCTPEPGLSTGLQNNNQFLKPLFPKIRYKIQKYTLIIKKIDDKHINKNYIKQNYLITSNYFKSQNHTHTSYHKCTILFCETSNCMQTNTVVWTLKQTFRAKNLRWPYGFHRSLCSLWFWAADLGMKNICDDKWFINKNKKQMWQKVAIYCEMKYQKNYDIMQYSVHYKAVTNISHINSRILWLK